MFSLSQLPILTKSWLVYHFPKYFQKELLHTLQDLFVCVCHKNVTDTSASGRTVASCFPRPLDSLPVQGRMGIRILLRAVVGDPTLSYIMSEIPMEPLPMWDGVGLSSILVPELMPTSVWLPLCSNIQLLQDQPKCSPSNGHFCDIVNKEVFV